MIEWFPEDMTPEEKLEFYSNIPIKIRVRAYFIEMCYGNCYIVKNKDDTYHLYYQNYVSGKLKEELVKDV